MPAVAPISIPQPWATRSVWRPLRRHVHKSWNEQMARAGGEVSERRGGGGEGGARHSSSGEERRGAERSGEERRGAGGGEGEDGEVAARRAVSGGSART